MLSTLLETKEQCRTTMLQQCPNNAANNVATVNEVLYQWEEVCGMDKDLKYKKKARRV